MLALGTAALVAFYTVRFDGAPAPIDARLVAHFPEGIQWLAAPSLAQQDGRPTVIYVVPPAAPDTTGRFAAIRIDLDNGARTADRIPLTPASGYVPFEPAEVTGAARVELKGVSFPRPTFHLFRIPGDGGGPGFHSVESATGIARVVATRSNDRPLATRVVFNSASLPEMRSQLSSDRAGRMTAFVTRQQDGWTVFLWDQAAGAGAR
jgi:hypothetical protein